MYASPIYINLMVGMTRELAIKVLLKKEKLLPYENSFIIMTVLYLNQDTDALDIFEGRFQEFGLKMFAFWKGIQKEVTDYNSQAVTKAMDVFDLTSILEKIKNENGGEGTGT